MKALVVYCHPNPRSFTAALRDVVMNELKDAGAEVRLIDLYKNGFNPVMSQAELACYDDEGRNCSGLEEDTGHLCWCDTLLFVYPTWWYGMPAILKGWLDRVFLPGIAFRLPQNDGDNIKPCLDNITRLGVFTTCGASWWLTRYIGAPGRRTLMRGVRLLCPRGCKTVFAAHYSMDSSTDASRARHLARVATKMRRFVGTTPQKEVTA